MLVPVSYSKFERGVNMPIQISTTPYVCRVSKSTRVYKEAIDIAPTTRKIPERTIFVSYQQIKTDTSTMFYISAPLDEKTYSDDIPYDKWIPSDFIEFYLLDNKGKIALPKERSEYFLTNKRDISLFDNSLSDNPIGKLVEEGVFIETDKFIVRENSEKRQTRYRIKAINDNENHEYCGMWMEGNPVIYTNGLKMNMNDAGLRPVDKNSPFILHRKKRIEDTAYVDEGDNYLEVGGYVTSGEPNKSKNKAGQQTTTTTPKQNQIWGITINSEVVRKAVAYAKQQNVTLSASNYNRDYILSKASDYYKLQYWRYYCIAALEYSSAYQPKFKNDGTAFNTMGDSAEAKALQQEFIRLKYTAKGSNAWSKDKLVDKFGEENWKWSNADQLTPNSGVTMSTSGSTSAIDNEIANDNVTENATVPATGVTEEELRAERAAAAGEITWNDTTLEDLYQAYGLVYTTDVSLSQVPIGRLSFVHGMPFQYTYLTDRRNNLDTPFGREMFETDEPVKSTRNSGAGLDMYGRTFAREIASNTPIVVFTPGTPKFMSNIRQSIFGYNGGLKNARNSFLNLFADLSFSESSSALQSMFDDLEGEVFQYYSLEINTAEYFSIVNSLCQFSAKLMGLDSVKMRNTPCTLFDWAAYNTNEAHDYSTMEDVFGVSRGVSFAFDPVSSIQDSISNSIGESQFASLFNGVSDKSRELAFMLGSVDIDLDMIDQNEYTAAVNSVRTGAFSGLTNPMSSIFSMLKNSAHGMRVRFPQLWQESSISKSYSLDMKFITPYATKFCKWRYVLVPFFHIFALAAPQSKDSIINYSRPFLVKAFSRGYFNIEMGIIDQLSWKRYGDGEMLSVDGIPTEIDVSVDLTDMYQQLAASTHYGDAGIMSLDRIKVFFNNAGLQELIGNLAGIDTNRITLSERLALYASTIRGTLGGSSAGLGRHIQDRLLTNNVARWFYGMSGTGMR